MASRSPRPGVETPSVWQDIQQDTRLWVTDLSFSGGLAVACWVTASSALIGKVGKVNPLLPAITFITGFVTIKIFKTIHDHNPYLKNKDAISQAIGCYCGFVASCVVVGVVQLIALGKCLGIPRKSMSLLNPGHKVVWIAFPATCLGIVMAFNHWK